MLLAVKHVSWHHIILRIASLKEVFNLHMLMFIEDLMAYAEHDSAISAVSFG